MTWQFVLTGLLIGALVGMTGMGGGSLMTPILVIVFGFKPTLAVGTDIVHGAIFKTVGAVRHRQLGTVHAQLSGWMFLGQRAAVAARRRGRDADHAQVRRQRDDGDGLRPRRRAALRRDRARAEELRRRARWSATTTASTWSGATASPRSRSALVGGFIVGLTSVGSGTFFGLTMLFVFPLRAHKVVGTDILHAAALLYVAGFGHFVAGNVDMGVVGWLLIGSIPGS